MQGQAAEFRRLVGAVLVRFCGQNGQPVPSDAEIEGFAARLWALVAERGLPRSPTAAEPGTPREMSETECAPLVARVLAGATDPVRSDAARQLVKACFYPEFPTCRESWRAASPDGACRRQELARARKRASGSHCVDCPHWLALEPAAHAEYLAANWRAGAAEFAAHREIFLPEDFRALRRWVREQA